VAFAQRWLAPQRDSAIETITRVGETSEYFISNMKFALAKGEQAMPCAFVTYDPPERVEDLARYGSAQHGGRIIELVAINRQIIDPLNQWEPRYQFTGFWRERHLPSWQPPTDLLNFLEAGSPPVVITMGSMMMFDPQRMVRLMIDALRASGQRGVIVGAWSGMDQAASELQHQSRDPICAIREAPYDWLFPRASCVIHHGGVGTVAAVLAAGVPSIILPQVLCQSHFGRLLGAQNLAAAVIPPGQLESKGLAQAITSALGETRYRSAARQWQEKVNAEDGVASAADMIESHARRLNSYAR
jgi:sterol 3beta-glucosyltransferase